MVVLLLLLSGLASPPRAPPVMEEGVPSGGVARQSGCSWRIKTERSVGLALGTREDVKVSATGGGIALEERNQVLCECAPPPKNLS